MLSDVIRRGIKLGTAKNTFFKCLEKVEVLSAADGKAEAQLKLEQEHCNLHGTMAGGMACTLNDLMTTAAIITEGDDNDNRIIAGVTLKLDVSCMSAAVIGETIIIDCSLLRGGKSIQYANMDIFEKTSGRLICRGQHILKSGIRGNVEDALGHQ